MANVASSSAIVASGSVAIANEHVLTSGGNSGISISLHPLPILSISEHHTRNLFLSQNPSLSKVIGALLGTQTGREISIVNTFELVAAPAGSNDTGTADVSMDDEDNGVGRASRAPKWVLDRDFLGTRRDQFKEVFPTLELIGWYSVGAEPDGADVDLQAQMQRIIDTPLFLLLTPPGTNSSMITSASSDLPLKVYESGLGSESTDDDTTEPHITATASNHSEAAVSSASVLAATIPAASKDGPGAVPIKPGGKFVELAYTIETGEAERIAVDGAAKAGGVDEAEGAGNGLIASLNTQRNAINMLFDRMKIMLAYVRGVVDGTAQIDHAVLREISATIATLPTMNEDAFKEEFMIIADKASIINGKLADQEAASGKNYSGGGGKQSKVRGGGGRPGGGFAWNG